ncbi:hypothetical protein D3C80_1288870 [compost metagenome]
MPAVAVLAEGEGGGEAAGGQFRQPVLAQRLVVAQQQRRGGQAGAGEERRAEQVLAHLFEQDRLLDEAQAHAAVLLGNHQPRPAQLLGDLPPQLRVEALRAGHGGTHCRRIGGRGEKARRALLDHQLFVTQREVHYRLLWPISRSGVCEGRARGESPKWTRSRAGWGNRMSCKGEFIRQRGPVRRMNSPLQTGAVGSWAFSLNGR